MLGDRVTSLIIRSPRLHHRFVKHCARARGCSAMEPSLGPSLTESRKDRLKLKFGPDSDGPIAVVTEECKSGTLTSHDCGLILSDTKCKARVSVVRLNQHPPPHRVTQDASMFVIVVSCFPAQRAHACRCLHVRAKTCIHSSVKHRQAQSQLQPNFLQGFFVRMFDIGAN